jgi:hypothetical protein
MRTVLGAIAFGVMTCGSAGASSFVTLGEPTPPKAAATAPTSPSLIVLGEPLAPEPIASIPARPVDGTETASIPDPKADAAPRAGAAAADAAADWARISKIKTASVLYMGQPDVAAFVNAEQTEQKVAAFDPHKTPMVMRGGIFGDLSAMPEDDKAKPAAAGDAATPPPADDSKMSRRERLDKEKADAKAAAEAAAAPLAPSSSAAPTVKR